tara:strand:+ start:609 stop:806 length:198 start_codon:yes stop_codon:yes gene_type:complete
MIPLSSLAKEVRGMEANPARMDTPRQATPPFIKKKNDGAGRAGVVGRSEFNKGAGRNLLKRDESL